MLANVPTASLPNPTALSQTESRIGAKEYQANMHVPFFSTKRLSKSLSAPIHTCVMSNKEAQPHAYLCV
jgi:hypothetical protein